MTVTDALQALEQEWRRLGAPTEQALAPGVPEREVRRRLEGQLHSVTPELVAWFGWHDGCLYSAWQAAPLGLQLLSLDEALISRQQQLTVQPGDPVSPGPTWNPGWLPITDAPSSAMYALDTDTQQLLFVDWWSAEFAEPVAPDLQTAVLFWVDVLRQDYYRWINGKWMYDFERIPSELRASRLLG